MTEMIKGAIFSLDRTYRYMLSRRWSEGRRQFVVIGLNPSVADENADDPTIRRCITFAKRERCDALVMLNLFALVSTDPKALAVHADPVGPGNDATIEQYAWGDSVIVVAAWGAHPIAVARAKFVKPRVPALNCFGHTKSGAPRHPLYLPASAPLCSYSVSDLHALEGLKE